MTVVTCAATISAAYVATIPSLVAAQDAPNAGLEEVIVTARKRAESLQDVPVAVTALTGGMIERGNINSVVEVAKLAPNVELIAQPFAGAALAASIRGVGLDDLEKTFEPTVAVSVDGVFYSSTAGANVDLFDVEGIEVLRGPQGTLFGRNTIGGVINIQRSKPTGEWGMRLSATFDEFEREDVKAVINTPLGNRGGLKVSPDPCRVTPLPKILPRVLIPITVTSSPLAWRSDTILLTIGLRNLPGTTTMTTANWLICLISA